MLINDVSMVNVSEYRYMKLPKCVRRGSLRRLIDDINLQKHNDEEKGLWHDGLADPPTPDEDKKILAMETGIGLPDDLPPLDPPFASIAASRRVANPYTSARTTIEQPADISPLFKAVKQELAKRRNP